MHKGSADIGRRVVSFLLKLPRDADKLGISYRNSRT